MSRYPQILAPTRKPYISDLSDFEWEIIKHLLPKAKGFGCPRTVDLREILNAIFYVQKTGCHDSRVPLPRTRSWVNVCRRRGVARQWEMLPHDFPPYTTVYGYFQKWQRKGIWQEIHDQLRSQLREKLGRKAQSTVARPTVDASRSRILSQLKLQKREAPSTVLMVERKLKGVSVTL